MEKCVVIFEVVKGLFVCNVFVGISMDVVVVEVGVLKFMVYSYFGDKDNFFCEVVCVCLQDFLLENIYDLDLDVEIGQILFNVVLVYVWFDCDKEMVGIFCVIFSDCW